MNYSKQREIVYETLAKNAVHPTADKLHEIIKKQNPESNIGIATVYRNLKKMSEQGKIKKISGLEESEHFDHNTHQHYHFICNCCKKVYDIDGDIAPDITKSVENKTGFVVNHHDIVFNGVCKDCLKE